MVFSHGLSGNKEAYQGLYRDWASHGYLVIAIDHADGSNAYTKLKDDTVIEFNLKPLNDKDLRQSQVKTRSSEIIDLINELETPEFLKQIDDKAIINMSELVLGGHSFGGMTMIYTASLKLKYKIKTLWVFDPWMFPFHEEIIAGKLCVNVNMSLTNSDKFFECFQNWWDYKLTIKKLIKNNKKPTENKLILNTSHTHQVDYCVICPVDV
jgi:platelet-activating factor acetylhydrolase